MSGSTLNLSFSRQDHIVRAGAGAGKTYNLVQCVVEAYKHFKENSEKTPRFVLTTFTRKATQELRERMILKACELNDDAFFSFVTDPGHLNISTIHGVLSQFLREFGHLFEMDLSFKVLEGEEENALLEECARELLVADDAHLEWLKQIPFRRLLRMLKSYHYHFGKNSEMVAPDFDEAWSHTLEFVEKNRKSILEQIDWGLSSITDEPYLKSLNEIQEFLNLWEPEFELEMPSLARKTKRVTFPIEFHENFQVQLNQFKKVMKEIVLKPDELRNLSLQWNQFADFGKKFSGLVENKKKKGGFVTLSDLENQTARVLKESEFLGRIFSESFDFWLIDEFQDTSSHQLEILNRFIGDRPRFVVGDPQQSIYLFRGAESQIFDQEWARLSAAGARQSFLEKNYRSKRNLLTLLNSLMNQASQFSAMTPNDQSESDQPSAVFMVGEDLGDELRGLYKRALELCAADGSWDKICVLGRTHDDLFQVASYFRSKGIPTHVHSPMGYASRREIQDALSIYKFLVNPHDNLNLLQVLRSPWLKVEDVRLKEWMTNSPPSLWRSLKEEEKEAAILKLKNAERNLDSKGLLQTFIDLLSEIQFIEKSSLFDPSGRVEANIWKLIGRMKELEKKPGSHPLDIFNLLAQDSDAVAATEPNCINLMTIHGSKGLEFDHVFFPRLGRRFQTSKRGDITFSRDSSRFVFSLKDEDDQALVCSYEKEWIEEQKRREKEEVERWFYVALTRAKESITLSWNRAELTNESWVELFQLRTFQHEGLIRQEGPFEEMPLVLVQDQKLKVRPPFSDTDPSESSIQRSSFSEMTSESVGAWTPKSLHKKLISQAEGIHWHRLFESIRFQDIEAGLNDYPFLKNLKHPPFQDVLKNGKVEWGFQAKVGSRLFEGQVDLWGFDPDNRLWVIDYKTGSSLSSEKAKKQVQFYLWILKRKGLKPNQFCWAVIYPFEEKLIHGEMLDSEFESLEAEFGTSK